MRVAVRRIAASTTAGLLSLALLTGPADAGNRTFPDRRGDVGHPADVHRVGVIYGKRGVTVRFTVRNARAAARRSGGVNVYLDVRRKRRGPELALVGPISTGAYDWKVLTTRSSWRVRSREALCRSDIRTRAARDVVRVRFSRGCLRNPDVLKLRTGEVVRKQRRPAPRGIRVAVRSSTSGAGKSDWAPRTKTFYGGVRRG